MMSAPRITRPPGSSRLARVSDESGLAMAMVIGMILLLMVLVAATVSYAVSVAPQARHDTNWNAALAAAQAGVDDYVAHLNRTDNYAQSVDCTNLALKGPKAETNTCPWTSSTPAGWVDVQPGVPKAGQFHYDVNTTNFWYDGSVWVESTGRVNGVSRTIQVRVSRGGSTDFLYYTDFEDADPANTYVYPSGASAKCGGSSDASAAKYWWEDSSRGCVEISFAGVDSLDGWVHMNDTPLMCSSGCSGSSRPRFLMGYETSDPSCTLALGAGDSSGIGTAAGKGKCWRSTSGVLPYVGLSQYGAKPAGLLYLPDNSDKFSGFPGCHYYGDTRIRFNNNGTMDVWNSTSSGQTLLNPGTPTGTNCGTAASFVPASGKKYPTAKQTVPVPDNMVIYVSATSAGSATCSPGQVVNGTTSGSTSNDVIPWGSGTNHDQFPVIDTNYYDPDEIDFGVITKTFKKISGTWQLQTTTGPTDTITGESHQTTFDCGLGNVYIEGTVKGRVTVAATNNIIVTNNLGIDSAGAVGNAPAGTDIVGLVAANSVVTYHPASREYADSTPAVVESPSHTPTWCPASSSSGVPSSSRGSNNNTVSCTWQTNQRTFNANYDSITTVPGFTGSTGTRWIYASIQTLQHSFWVQSYKTDQLGTLSVRGSIAQKWRGIVGQLGTSGFAKDYSYDKRLMWTSPPYFPQWTNATWGAKTTGELAPAYS